MSYGLLGLKRQMEGEAMSGLQQLAGQQQQHKALNEQMKQTRKAQQMQAVGTGAGIGLMAGMKAGSIGGPAGAAIGAGVGLLASKLF